MPRVRNHLLALRNALPADLAPAPDAVEHSAALVRLIVDEIARAGGWIGFARYMQLALYAPGLGYYASGSHKLGAAGDFVTAPESSPLFAATLARQAAEVLGAAGGDILELGAGSGRLAAGLLQALADQASVPERYLILEVSGELRERQRTWLRRLPPALAARVAWIDTPPSSHDGLILGNEVLDAIPTHVVAWREREIFERGVVQDANGLAWQDRPLRAGPVLDAARQLNPPPPYVSEINLAAPALVASVAGILRRGVMLFIDYGFGSREYYHPQRSAGTLMCHYRHRAHGDPFFLPGLQDITAHVDFTAVAQAGARAGLDFLGYTTQAQLLVNLGITDLLAGTSADDASAYLPRAAEAQQLLSPAEMGELFKAIALGRGLRGPLAGFRDGDKSHLL